MIRYKEKPFTEYRLIHKTSAGRYMGQHGFTLKTEAQIVAKNYRPIALVVRVKVSEIRKKK